MTARNRAVWESIDKRINKLEEENKRLKGVLEKIAGMKGPYMINWPHHVAQQALDQKERKQ